MLYPWKNCNNGYAVYCVAVVFFLIILNPCGLVGQQVIPRQSVLQDGEVLVYNVRYGFIDLGQVRIKTNKKLNGQGAIAYEAIAYIDSYKKVPFVNLHAIFESAIDSGMFSHFFIGKSLDGDYWNFGRYVFDYERDQVFMESGNMDTVVQRRDTLKLDGSTQDGLSMFFYAREQLYSRKKQKIQAIVKERKVHTVIDFFGEQKSIDSDFVDYPVDVIGFEGTMEFTGIFGLTGDFEGWFSNDDARIPIIAKMEVILGNVTIELMEWNRAGWNPPRADD